MLYERLVLILTYSSTGYQWLALINWQHLPFILDIGLSSGHALIFGMIGWRLLLWVGLVTALLRLRHTINVLRVHNDIRINVSPWNYVSSRWDHSLGGSTSSPINSMRDKTWPKISLWGYHEGLLLLRLLGLGIPMIWSIALVVGSYLIYRAITHELMGILWIYKVSWLSSSCCQYVWLIYIGYFIVSSIINTVGQTSLVYIYRKSI